jgi:hypothetical protein
VPIARRGRSARPSITWWPDGGFHFDPECLDAFLAVLAEQGVHPGGRPGDVQEVLRSAEACHDAVDSLAASFEDARRAH